MIRGWALVVPGCNRTSMLSSGAITPQGGSIIHNQSQISQWGWGFHILPSGIDPGGARFVPGLLEF